jgi:serine/threonine-protein kinase
MRLSRFVSVLASIVAGCSSQALADNYGAIAFSNSSGAWGTSHDYGSRRSAEQSALNRCGAGCSVVLWFRNACGALATTQNHAYGTGWATDLGDAQNIALSGCRPYGSCGITAWACTTR